MNLSVIPIGKDKRPLVKWEEFQSRRPSLGDIKGWWKAYPSANVGIVTGKISGLAVVDCDSDDANKRFLLLAGNEFKSPIAKTPRGGNHYYCKHTDGQGNNTGALPKVDLRAEGGYVVAPPSVGTAGNYSWTIPIDKCKLPNLPPDYIRAIKESRPRSPSTQVDTTREWFTEGRRDDDLFSLAWSLVKSGMPRKDIEDIISNVASTCKPPFPKKDAELKIKSAVERAFRKERNLIQEIKNFIAITDGYFRITSLYGELQIITKEDKNAARVILHRLKADGKIEHKEGADGLYRKVVIESMPVDWMNAQVTEYPIAWPFGLESFVSFYPANIAIIAGSPNAGKGHPRGTPILTPTGWNNIENLKVGDSIVNADGSWTTVTGIFQRGLQQIFKVEFNDHTWIECDYEHLWLVEREHNRSRKKTWDVLPTYALLAQPYFNHKDRFQIPLPKPMDFSIKDAHIHPYVVGALLGDGCLSKTSVGITTADLEIVKRISRHYQLGKTGKTHRHNRCPTYSILKFMPLLRKSGLAGKRSWEKYIPKEYLFNSIENRMELLRGLMDTDGTISLGGKTVSFTSTSKQLTEDVVFLVRSLGEKAVLGKERRTYYEYKGEKKRGRVSYRAQISIKGFNPFYLKRKATRVMSFVKRNNKVITSITPVGIKESICLSIDNPNGLYVAKDFIVTHNTAFLIDVVRKNMKQCEVHFHTSEMGASETKIRLALHEGIELDEWKFCAWERSSNFADVIRPNALNIIDYLEVGTEFYTVGVTISDIHEKLKDGVAIMAIQKNYGQDLGRGASFGTEKPRLYLSLDAGTLKIIKAKNWKGTENPNGKQIDFKLIRGWKFIPESDWYIPQVKR